MRYRDTERRERFGDEGWVPGRTVLDEWRCKGDDLIWGEGSLDPSDSATCTVG